MLVIMISVINFAIQSTFKYKSNVYIQTQIRTIDNCFLYY